MIRRTEDENPRTRVAGPRAPVLAKDVGEPLQELARRAGSGRITDADGLARAYQQGDAYMHGKTLYIAGSHTARDWMDDLTRIPLWRPLFGGSKAIHRYQMAQQAARATKPDTVVGHSLGGAIALQMQKEDPTLQSRTYGAPVFDPLGQNPSEDRLRSRFDPVSILYRGPKAAWMFRPPTCRRSIATKQLRAGALPMATVRSFLVGLQSRNDTNKDASTAHYQSCPRLTIRTA